MTRLHGGPADGCEVPDLPRRKVLRVRVQDGAPVRDSDGGLLVTGTMPSSANDTWVPYVYNESGGHYRYARWEPDHVPAWYPDRLKALASEPTRPPE